MVKKICSIESLLISRSINGITKHSTYQDITANFGEPDIFRLSATQYSNLFLNYGNIYFGISKIKKRVNTIGISLDKEFSRAYYRRFSLSYEASIYKDIIDDYNKYSMIDAEQLIKNLSDVGFNCNINPLWSNNMDDIYSPVNDKPYTMLNPRFIFHVSKDTLKTEYLDIIFNYKALY